MRDFRKLLWTAVSVALSMSLLPATVLNAPMPIVSCSIPSFSTATNIAVGAQPLSVVIGDFNNDGKRDLAVANFTSNSVSILLGNGAGGFGAATNFNAGANPSALVAADFNGDGKLDLAVAASGSDSVSILLGNGAGGFNAPANFFVGANPSAIVVADFNTDGKLDLAVANADSDTVSILLGNGAGGFASAINIPAGSSPLALAVGDFNGDGKPDLAVADFNFDVMGGNVSILLGDGAGRFARGNDLIAGAEPTAIIAADFNGDGRIDLAVVNSGSYDVSVFLGNGNATFASSSLYDVGVSPTAVATGDFNNDGKIDLAVTNSGSNNVSILSGNGVGGFAPAINFSVGASPSGVTAGDLNADGSTDLAVANADSGTLSLLLNNCGALTPRLLTDETTGRAAALDSVTLVRDPFSVFTNLNFSADGRTRIALFAANLDLLPGDNASIINAQAVTAQGRVYSLPVEFAGAVPNFDWLTEIVVRLPDAIAGAGDVQVSITARGAASNKVVVSIK